MCKPIFKKEIIGELVNDGHINTYGGVGHFRGTPHMDFAVCGRFGTMAWFENPGNEGEIWNKHIIGPSVAQECGGSAIDLTSTGLDDIINGSDGNSDEMCWYENPGMNNCEWKRHLIVKTGMCQQHDTLIAPIKNDGINYLIFTNQNTKNRGHKGTAIFCVPIPQDPFQSPWPNVEIVSDGKCLMNPLHPWNSLGIQSDEGLAYGDLDNDGQLELVCGVCLFKWVTDHWIESRFTDKHYITTKIIIADIDCDGHQEIILSEGDSWIYGEKEGGKVAWFKPQGNDIFSKWSEHIIETGVLDGHSIAVADLCGNGKPDLFLGEIGGVNGDSEEYVVRPPRLMIYENDGNGQFLNRYIIDEGTGIHEAVLCDLNGNGKLDIIGKPLHGPEKYKIVAWYQQ